MSRTKRNEKELTQTLVGFFVTESEKKLIEKAKPEDQSMSDYIRTMVLPKVKRELVRMKEAKKQT
jgi:hypothetical protein